MLLTNVYVVSSPLQERVPPGHDEHELNPR